MTALYWCERAWLPPGVAAPHVLVHVTGSRISAVETGVTNPPANAKRLAGVTLPGLANVHSHAFHRALRGRTHGRLVHDDPSVASETDSAKAGSFWSWRDRMYEIAGRLDPDSYRALATAVYAEMALAGITCVGEFHYVHHNLDGTPYAEPNVMAESLIQAARTAGLRITLLDACYLTGGIDLLGGSKPLEGVQRRFGDGNVARWADRVADLRHAYASAEDVHVGAAIHSVRAVPADQMPEVVTWARTHDAPLHVHLSEQVAENAQCLAAHGLSPTRLLLQMDVLSPRTTAIHATHLTGEDIGLLADTDTTICMCPTTERDLADGIGPAASLGRAGCRLTLGTDSHAVVDMFEEARGLEFGERLLSGRRSNWSVTDLIRAMTESGHQALGFADAGVIAPGAWADLVSVHMDSVRTAGVCDLAESDHSTDVSHPAGLVQAYEMTVFAATAADVHSVVSGGQLIVDDGRHRLGDVAAALRSAISAVACRP